MTEHIVEQGIETAKTEGLLVAVTDIKKEESIRGVDEQSAIENIVIQGLEEDIFLDEHVQAARRAAIIARNSLRHRRKTKKRRF